MLCMHLHRTGGCNSLKSKELNCRHFKNIGRLISIRWLDMREASIDSECTQAGNESC